MGLLEDMLKALDRVEIWKELQAAPSNLSMSGILTTDTGSRCIYTMLQKTWREKIRFRER
jgi:hypothetical protein